jgi:hypothetical protein
MPDTQLGKLTLAAITRPRIPRVNAGGTKRAVPEQESTMSTSYGPLGPLAVTDLLDGRLEAYGITQHRNSEGQLCLYDSMNYVHVYVDDKGLVSGFTRYAGNNAYYIVESISEAFGLRIASEYEPEYWGFATQAEWDLFQEEISREHEDQFYADVIRYAKGEPNGIHPETIGHIKAEIAKALITAEPSLAKPDMRAALMAQVDERDDHEHAVVVKLDSGKMADLDEWFERTAEPYGTRGTTN